MRKPSALARRPRGCGVTDIGAKRARQKRVLSVLSQQEV
jgi:hypothetical protein